MCDVIDGNRANQSGNRSDAVRHAHQDARISWRNIQMIDIVAGDGKAAERHAERQGRQCAGLKTIASINFANGAIG